MTDDLERDSVKWFADDFETTTDLDGPPAPYELDTEETALLANLEPGDTRLTVSITKKHGVRTITATRDTEGNLTATTRTGRVRVWAWAIAPLDGSRIHTGTNIETYVDKAAELGGIHWFHNLRFDGAFLDAYLIDTPPIGLGLSVGDWRPRSVPPGSLGSLISGQGAHYSRYVRLNDGRRFEVRDSLKKFPGTTVAALAKMYGHPIGKGEIDYTAERPHGYQPTWEEWEYIKTDVAIVRTALNITEAIGNTGLTIGGDAISEYRATMEHGKYRTVFPVLDRDLDEWIRRAYRGGWTYVNPTYQGQLLEEPGSVWDVNSMYPAVMHSSSGNSFPVGEPVRLAAGQHYLEEYPHTITGALMDATIKPGHYPIIQIKGDARYNPTQYQTEVYGVEWYGTEVDWRLLYEQYDVEIHEWVAGFAFQGIIGLFDRYINKWMEVKTTTTGGMRTQAKFQLNNLWGRFGINPLRAGRLPAIDDHGAIRYNLTPEEYGEPAYTPVAVYTTSYGRDSVIRAAQNFGERFLAADTDSCHVLGTDPGNLEVHDTKLGAWKREAIFNQATYLRAKAYAERVMEDDGTTNVEAHVAGLPRKLLQGARVEDITIGTRYSGKLVPKRVPGGVILVSTDFEIGERDAWGHRN